jgi:hypothetical protein
LSEIRDAMEAADTASEDSSPSAPESSTPEVSSDSVASPVEDTAVTATPQPSDTGVVADTRGPIPYARHEAVLNSTREKYAWAEKYGDPSVAQQRLAVTEWMERDPVGFLRTYAANQGIDPQALFPHHQAAPPAPKEEAPAPDILLENGQETYSHGQLQKLLAFERRQLTEQFSQQLAPIQQERMVTQRQQQAYDHARQQIAKAKALPGFTEHEEDLKAYLKANPTASLNDAYMNVVPAKMAEALASAGTTAYQKALTDLQTKAGAASIPAPRTAGTPVVDTSNMTIRQALEHALRG